MSGRKILFALAMLFAACSLPAQVAMQIEPSHSAFILYDNVFVKLHLRNYSAKPVVFGAANAVRGDIDFKIIGPRNTLAAKRSTAHPMIDGVILGPGETKSLTFSLGKYYDMQESGAYSVVAILKHPQFKDAYQSNQITFSIRSGQPVWERETGMPDYIGKEKNGIVKTRKFKLLKFSDSRNVAYYIMIEDKKNVYMVKRIAFDLGVNLLPQVTLDSMARMHILVAVSAKVFAYYIYSGDGKLEKRDIYISTTSKPMLVVNSSDASVVVSGGRIARKDTDFEEIKDLPLMDEIKSESGKEVFDMPLPGDGEKEKSSEE